MDGHYRDHKHKGDRSKGGETCNEAAKDFPRSALTGFGLKAEVGLQFYTLILLISSRTLQKID